MANLIYTATRSVVRAMEFHCAACGYRSPVQVEGKGASQVAVAGSATQAAGQQASAAASVYAMRWAEIYLELCPCPKCGKRDPAHAAPFKKKNWIVFGVSAALTLVGAVLLALGVWVGGVVVTLVGFLGVLIAPLMARSTWVGAARKVHFPVADG